MRQSVHQIVPSFALRDAIGNHTLALRDTLRDMGFASDIFAYNAHPKAKSECRPTSELDPHTDALIYQLSIGSPVAEMWAQHHALRVVNYHNITPWPLIGRWDETIGNEVVLARDQLYEYAPRCDHAIAVSEFNRTELDLVGYRSTETIPVLFDPLDAQPDNRLTQKLQRDKKSHVLFVGRLLPHKNQHQLVAATRALRDCFDVDAHLHLVGGRLNTYREALFEAVAAGDMDRHVTYHEKVTEAELAALYRGCDVFCCVSDHEGFCVPLIEAMSNDLPVVAYDAAAVGETVADGGMLLEDRHPYVVAAALQRVLSDDDLAEHMRRAGRQRAADFAPARTREKFRSSFVRLMGDL